MATATKTPKPAAKPVRKAAPTKGKTSLDYLQQALDDLDKARAKAQQDAHAAIDAAVERIRAAATDLRSRAAEPARDIEERLEQVSEDARREIGRMAIDAQRSPEALAEMAAQIRRRKRALTG